MVVVQVKFITGKTLFLEFQPADTIAEVKKRIHGLEGIPVEQLSIIYAGRALEDGRTLADYNIAFKSDALLHVRVLLKGGASVSVRTLTGKMLAFGADLAADTVGAIKARIQSTEGTTR